MNPLVLAWRQLRRDFASGDVRILFVALVLAVVAITSVGFVTDRAAARSRRKRIVCSAAMRACVGFADHRSGAQCRECTGLQRADTIEMRSMVRVGERCSSANCARSIDSSPCAAMFRLVDRIGGPERVRAAAPRPARRG
jgi:putative ABC transport system permease protein